MKNIRIVFFAVFAILMATSCHRDQLESGCRVYDFGVVRYPASPFVGILKNHPIILEKSLDRAPYKWCVHNSQYGKEREFHIGFNTGAYRDSAESKVLFCDNDGNLYADDVIRIFINGVDQKVVMPLSARNTSQNIAVGLLVNPKLKDTTITGCIAFCTEKLDVINNHSIASNPSVLDSWVIKQKKPCFFWLYFLWLLTALLILCVLLILLCIIVLFTMFGIEGVRNFIDRLSNLFSGNKNKRKQKKNKQKQKKNKVKEEPVDDYPKIMLLSNYVYSRPSKSLSA